MADLDLRPERRDQLAAGLRAQLEAFVPGSVTALRGSLAAGAADSYSDIDLCWVAWDETFGAAVSAAEGLAVRLASVRVVRIDPGLAFEVVEEVSDQHELAGVAAVGPGEHDLGERLLQVPQQRFRGVAVLDAGGNDQHG
jgi:predicted nucleotidyltransferase